MSDAHLSSGLPVYILAAGRSTRFGEDKASALVGGEPMVSHVVREVACVASRITIIAHDTSAFSALQTAGVRVIADRTPDRGPLSGLDAALADLSSREPWCLLTACDLLDVRPAWLRALRAECATTPSQAVAFRGARWHPVPACYHASLSGAVSRALSTHRLAVWPLLDQHARALPTPEGWDTLARLDTRAAADAWAARQG